MLLARGEAETKSIEARILCSCALVLFLGRVESRGP